jgi:Uma2 family endonuclease
VSEPALKSEFVSAGEYLAEEQVSATKHEYLAGIVYAMAGTTIEHNLIAQNIAFALRSHLRGKPCRLLMLDVKLRIQINQQDTFYYPDVMVGCDSRDREQLYLEHPKLIVEVASASTERIDRHEKLAAYQGIESLENYIIVAQERPEIVLFSRKENWVPETVNGSEATVLLESVGFELPLTVVYEGVR